MAAEDFLQDVHVRQSPRDPWVPPLQRVRGKIGDKSAERISTQALFDCLEVLGPIEEQECVATWQASCGGPVLLAYLANSRGYCRRPS